MSGTEKNIDLSIDANKKSSRILSQEEASEVITLPPSHRVTEEEIRICKEIERSLQSDEMKITNILLEGDAGSGKTQLAKALSANLNLPYCKITCFADMDKSDVMGSILPVIEETQLEALSKEDASMLKALYESDGTQSPLTLIKGQLGEQSTELEIRETWKRLKALAECNKGEGIEYRFYPSEIVRAFQKGYLLEIQEPTVIRDAAVLMSLNSALEPGGSINLPTGVIHRHPDFIAVITTNRNYAGCRPLNEALRDRIQHAEKMDLPPKEVMAQRALAKTGGKDIELATNLSEVIIRLDQAAKANGIRGVAGMRSLFYWLDTVQNGEDIRSSMYYKVIYKMTTDPDEIKLLEQAIEDHPIFLRQAFDDTDKEEESETRDDIRQGDEMKQTDETETEDKRKQRSKAVQEGLEMPIKMQTKVDEKRSETDGGKRQIQEALKGNAFAKELLMQGSGSKASEEEAQGEKKDFDTTSNLGDDPNEEAALSKKLNQKARSLSYGESHKGIRICVRRPKWTEENRRDYLEFSGPYKKIAEEAIRQTKPYLQHEESTDFTTNRFYGVKFNAEAVAKQDYRVFSKKNPPAERPSLAVALRIDESGSMSAGKRVEYAKAAALTIWEFCRDCHIPVAIYGDTANISSREDLSLYAYADFDKPGDTDGYRMMQISPKANNRDGAAIRFVAERLMEISADTKLLFVMSDGNPRALEHYHGLEAEKDLKEMASEYRRKGITLLAAAIGEDKESIQQIYGEEHFLNITDLQTLPMQLVKIIKRYL